MYKLTNKIKSLSIVCIVVGILGIIYSFFSVPSSVHELETLLNVSNHAHSSHDMSHMQHLLHLHQNKPWAAFYVSALFFMLISLASLVFYAINRASQAGWSPVLFRVMEGITGYLLPGAVIFFLVLVLSGLDLNHLFVWMDKGVVESDKILQGKQGFLNVPFFLLRSFIYMFGWVGYRYVSRRLSILEDNALDNKPFIKNIKFSAGFLVFFLVTESMMSWDWVMSFDPHWYSTLFAWYIFMSSLASAVAVIILLTIYLKKNGYLEFVNDSHLHDLGKYLFGFSVFWTYLWFSQYLLIWYSNMPEETVYYISRVENYPQIFFGMVVLNFVFPLLVLIDSDMKRKQTVLTITSIVVLIGHYLDFYLMVIPSTVSEAWSIGIGEVSSFIFFLGLFIYIVLSSVSKAPLLAKNNPFIEESKGFHY